MILFLRSLPRLIKNANKDIRRHFSMTFSCILSIAISLLLAMVMAAAAANIDRISGLIESQMQLQVLIEPWMDDEKIQELEKQVDALEGTAKVTYSSKEEELDALIEESGSVFEQYKDSNPLYDVFVVDVDPLSQIETVSQSIAALDGIYEVSYGGDSIQKLIAVFASVREVGFVLSASLMILAVFLIRNTIRLNIMVRSDEIAIMRSVGAYNFYIYMPFVIAGMVMGFWGALIPTLIVDGSYIWLYHILDGHLISPMFALYPPLPFLAQLSAASMAIGLLLGGLGSWMASRKLIRRTR